MTISTQRHWLLRCAWLGALLLLGAAFAVWVNKWEISPHSAQTVNRIQLSEYQENLEKLSIERDQLSATVDAAESQLNIERSAQKQLVMQVKALENENLKLKEDLAFFESLLPTDAGVQGVSIRRLKAEAVTPNQLRYQLLIMQGGKSTAQFIGNLHLVVSAVQGGKNVMIDFPTRESGNAEKFKLSFKHYQRAEGVLTLPEGVSVTAVQARILNNGQVRTQLSVNL